MKLFLVTLIFCAIELGSAVDPFNLNCKKYEGDTVILSLYNNKYYFSWSKKNWYGAFNFCRSYNMQLATPSTSAKYTDLLNYINILALDRAEVWIGGSDEGHEGTFKWRNTGESLSYTYWSSGEPNNEKHKNKGWENCMDLYYNNGYKWNDNWCGYELYFVCERTKDPEPANTQLCSFN